MSDKKKVGIKYQGVDISEVDLTHNKKPTYGERLDRRIFRAMEKKEPNETVAEYIERKREERAKKAVAKIAAMTDMERLAYKVEQK